MSWKIKSSWYRPQYLYKTRLTKDAILGTYQTYCRWYAETKGTPYPHPPHIVEPDFIGWSDLQDSAS